MWYYLSKIMWVLSFSAIGCIVYLFRDYCIRCFRNSFKTTIVITKVGEKEVTGQITVDGVTTDADLLCHSPDDFTVGESIECYAYIECTGTYTAYLETPERFKSTIHLCNCILLCIFLVCVISYYFLYVEGSVS